MAAELPRPDSTSDDPNATEMIRIWLAHNSLQITVRLGMWSDDHRDEKEAWGYLFADVIRHISQGLAVRSNWEPDETMRCILESLSQHIQRLGGSN